MNHILKIVLIVSLLLLGAGAAGYVWLSSVPLIEKPAVYLYPEKDMYVDVEVDVDGWITVSDPFYGDGWHVFATREGVIDGKYDYLFYEAAVQGISTPDDGWVVAYSELEGWFDEYLVLFGLNEKEKSQFKEYWLEVLPHSEYYVIRRYDSQVLEEKMRLFVKPEPDTVIRVILDFEPVSERVDIVSPDILTPERDGFTVVEWGGVLSD